MKIQKFCVVPLQKNFIHFVGRKKNAPIAVQQETYALKSSEITGNYAIASMQINKSRNLTDKINEEEAKIADKLNEIDLGALEIDNMQQQVRKDAKKHFESACKAYEIRNKIANNAISEEPLFEDTSELFKYDSKITIDELDKNDNLVKQIEYSGGIPEKITVVNSNGTEDIYEYNTSMISNGHEGFVNLNFTVKKDVKNQKADTMFEFQNGNLVNVYKNVKFNKSSLLYAKKVYNFDDDGSLYCYGEGLKGKVIDKNVLSAQKQEVNSLGRLYCLSGDNCALITNTEFKNRMIRSANNGDSMYCFDEDNKVEYAFQTKPDGSIEKFQTS